VYSSTLELISQLPKLTLDRGAKPRLLDFKNVWLPLMVHSHLLYTLIE
jgi:hypothetical protein